MNNSVQVKSIRKVGKRRVMNLTVDNNHTFVTENGIVTHNCEQASKETLNSLKGLIEQFSENAVFVFTTNHINLVPDALKSRCNMVSFDVEPDDRQELVKQVFIRSKKILENEHVTYDDVTLAKAVKNTFPDFRKLLNTLQKASTGGELDSSVLATQGGYDVLIDSINSGNWKEMREWCANYYQYFSFTEFYDELSKSDIPGPKQAEIVILTANYDYKQSMVSDKQINIIAYLTETMIAMRG